MVELLEQREYKIKRECDLSGDIDINEKIIDITFVLEVEGLLVTCRSGEMYRVNSDDEVVNVGSIESGVVAVGWSTN